MLPIVITMIVIVALAAVIVAYVAFPHRGNDLPAAPWVGNALKRGVAAMPTLGEPEDTVKRR